VSPSAHDPIVEGEWRQRVAGNPARLAAARREVETLARERAGAEI
jgi:hypothetical protein